MIERTVEFLRWLPNEIITLLIAMLPIAELRGAIPWALTGGGLTWHQAYLFAAIGNFLPVIPLLLLIEPLSNWLRGYKAFDIFFAWLFARTRRRGKLVERYEALGLALFVSIPLPVTGAWTGAVAAFVFGIRLSYSIIAIIAGILIAGVIVTLASLGVMETIKAIGIYP
ncbi:small multi-drug export protein [candidate division KSB1 bacterium]|nr:small multi-drug export protein [candidate division KSB1 bacterium]